MNTGLRRIRGTIGMGLTWSVVWAIVGAVVGVVETYAQFRHTPDLASGMFPRMVLATSTSWASYGFALGCLFASVLAIAERRRSLEQLATWRIAIWGGIAGTLLPLAFMIGAGLISGVIVDNGLAATVLSATLGAGSAAATLTLARARPSPRAG